jgi:hypothetical protein
MTERFPRQRNSSAQRRADADQVSASAPGDAVFPSDAAFPTDAALPADAPFRNASHSAPHDALHEDASLVLDESFVAAAPAREPSAQARAQLASRSLQLRQDGEPRPARETLGRWSVRPSHHLAAVRLLPAVALTVSVLAFATVLFILVR